MRRDRLFNILSLGMLGLTVLLLLYYILLAVNPQSALNPFPPIARRMQIIATPTPLATPTRESAATWTPTTTPTITPTPPPSFTPTITPSPTPVPPTRTPIPPTVTPTPTPRVTRSPYPYSYELQYETPLYGCSWMGVAGIVQNLDGEALKGYPIHVWGGGIDQVVNSGDKQMYGDAGWEQFLFNQPVEMRGIFRVQLHSPYDPHPPISAEIVLDFQGFCSQSMAYIIFTQNH